MLKGLKDVVRKIVRPPLHKPEVRLPYVFLGTEYGGWPLLKDETPPGALVYSFGIGEDVSFDLAAIEKFGCRINAFDPTPKSTAWLASQKLPSEFVFHPIGIANRDGEAEFFAPATEGYVSFSVSPDPSVLTASSIKAKVMRLASIVSLLDSIEPNILKMDIEGFEYDVIADMLAGTIRPQQLLVEFHHDMYGIPAARTTEVVYRLRQSGYKLYYVSSIGREYGFARI